MASVTAIIGALSRLVDAGMDEDDAIETVLQILGRVNRRGAPRAPLHRRDLRGQFRALLTGRWATGAAPTRYR